MGVTVHGIWRHLSSTVVGVLIFAAVTSLFVWKIDSSKYDDPLLSAADFTATFVFAFTGTCAAFRFLPRLHLILFFPIAALCGFISANGGGTTCSLLIGQSKFTDADSFFWWSNKDYIWCSIAGSVLALVLHSDMSDKGARNMDIADRLGLGVFVPIGAGRAFFVLGEDAPVSVQSVMLGFALAGFSAAGGGFWRDMLLLRRKPFALMTPYGLVPAFGGAFHIMMLAAMGGDSGLKGSGTRYTWLLSTAFSFLLCTSWKEWNRFHIPGTSRALICCRRTRPGDAYLDDAEEAAAAALAAEEEASKNRPRDDSNRISRDDDDPLHPTIMVDDEDDVDETWDDVNLDGPGRKRGFSVERIFVSPGERGDHTGMSGLLGGALAGHQASQQKQDAFRLSFFYFVANQPQALVSLSVYLITCLFFLWGGANSNTDATQCSVVPQFALMASMLMMSYCAGLRCVAAMPPVMTPCAAALCRVLAVLLASLVGNIGYVGIYTLFFITSADGVELEWYHLVYMGACFAGSVLGVFSAPDIAQLARSISNDPVVVPAVLDGVEGLSSVVFVAWGAERSIGLLAGSCDPPLDSTITPALLATGAAMGVLAGGAPSAMVWVAQKCIEKTGHVCLSPYGIFRRLRLNSDRGSTVAVRASFSEEMESPLLPTSWSPRAIARGTPGDHDRRPSLAALPPWLTRKPVWFSPQLIVTILGGAIHLCLFELLDAVGPEGNNTARAWGLNFTAILLWVPYCMFREWRSPEWQPARFFPKFHKLVPPPRVTSV